MKISIHMPVLVAGVVDVDIDDEGDIVSTTMRSEHASRNFHAVILEGGGTELPGGTTLGEVVLYAMMHLLKDQYLVVSKEIQAKYAQETPAKELAKA